MADWVEAEPLISWVKPQSGTTALVQYDLPLRSRDFCTQLLEEEGVLFTPGSAMDMEGWLRIGFANSTADLQDGLARVSTFLARQSVAQTATQP
ncbi:aminotransferase class I/II-fold pyridoxal phosphate-dependent enzyme [Sulfitobacter profundi]|uniref:Aminotransferase class I/II-fold pyridoxal phosphate-dependent enzyme n=1 Tax=Sulfitobacter profundi TaxID=2679961 RepID=A0ABW1Z2J3_9RHOB